MSQLFSTMRVTDLGEMIKSRNLKAFAEAILSGKEPKGTSEYFLVFTLPSGYMEFIQFLIKNSGINLKQAIIQNSCGPNTFVNTLLRSYKRLG